MCLYLINIGTKHVQYNIYVIWKREKSFLNKSQNVDT